MQAIRSSTSSCINMHAVSPLGTNILSCISHWDVPNQKQSKLCCQLITSCHSHSSSHPSVHSQTSAQPYKTVAHESKNKTDSKELQQQTIVKALHQVHVSNWVKHGMNSIFNGLGAFASIIPKRISVELNRFVSRAEVNLSDAAKDRSKLQVVKPISEVTLSPSEVSVRKKLSGKEKTRTEENVISFREQHTFEKAMEDTHNSIVSFYDTSASIKSAASVSPIVLPKDEHVGSNEKATAKEEDSSWNVFRQLQLPLPAWPFGESSSQTEKKKPLIRKDFISRSSIESRTKAVVLSMKAATSTTSKLIRIREFCKHLQQYPSTQAIAAKEKALPFLLKTSQSKVNELAEEAREALALLGYVFPLRAYGIRILTLDGGGTRGLVSIECLKKLEELSGRRIYELFDYVSGVSTGALIAAIICLFRLPLEECERLYKEFSEQMFTRNRMAGTGGLVWNHAFYSSEQWEKILQDEVGHKIMVEYARDPLVPKMSAVSSLMNTPHMNNFLFRNYNLPPESYSLYPGSCTHKMWEVIRASSAAPGYYEAFTLGDYVHMDGGLTTNNPTALAVHESKLLWPGEAVQCVVSIGTGRYEPTMELSPNKLSLKDKISKIVDSATDTEAVHMAMLDLMPPASYFRFNPYLSEDLFLDEIRPVKLNTMKRDTHLYLRKNELKLNKAIETLKRPRMPYQRALDWLKTKADMMNGSN